MVKIQKDWKQYLLRQVQLHPSMTPQDVYKLMFQAAFGAEHLLKDSQTAYGYFQKEYQEIEPREERLYEEIDECVCRVNLRAWKKKKLPEDWLFKMFLGSVNEQEKIENTQKHQKFKAYVEQAQEVIREGGFSFSYEAFLEYGRRYEQLNQGAVHHSERYRLAEQPAYRVVDVTYMRLIPVLEVVARHLEEYPHAPFVIAIDGRCASGKSTMARHLEEITECGIVHMDDFFLPKELRNKVRLANPGGNVHYERFKQEILPQLSTLKEFVYKCFDCGSMQLGKQRFVSASVVRVVEGAYSCHPEFGDYAHLKVFSNVEEKEQIKRIAMREGEEALEVFRERWIPMEEKYIEVFRIMESADIIV